MILSYIEKFKKLPRSTQILTGLFFLCVIWELFIFYRLPKQAWTEILLESWYTSKGLIYYKDFTNQYFPFLSFIMSIFHMVFGYTQTPTIILSPINSILVLSTLAVICYKWLTGWFRLIPLIFFIIWEPTLNENHYSTLAFLEIVNLLVFILWRKWFAKPNKWQAALIGFGLSASFFSMHIVFAFVGVIFLSILIKTIQNKKYLNSLIYAGIAFITPGILIIIWFWWKHALYDLYWWNIGYYFGYYPYASLGRGVINTTLFIAIFSTIFLFCKIIYLNLKGKWNLKSILLNKNLELVFITLIQLSFLIPIWFAIFHPTRFQLSIPIICFLLGYGIELILKIEKRLTLTTVLIISVIIIANLISINSYIWPKYHSYFLHDRRYNILSKVYPNDPMYDAVNWIKANTSSNSTLFVIADPLFYLETDRLPANPRGTMDQPFTYEPLGKFSQELIKKPPDYWVVDERLVHQRFHQFGYDHTIVFFDKLLACEPVVTRIEYITIRHHIKATNFCF